MPIRRANGNSTVKLGPVNKVWHPYTCGGKGEEGREGFRGFVEAYGNAPELLEPIEHAFEAVAALVGLEVAWGRVLRLALGGITGTTHKR